MGEANGFKEMRCNTVAMLSGVQHDNAFDG
jgi:hypothetical protein